MVWILKMDYNQLKSNIKLYLTGYMIVIIILLILIIYFWWLELVNNNIYIYIFKPSVIHFMYLT